MRILVIEDDEDLADAIVRRLRRLGHAVDWQNDGLSADGVLQYESFDLVIPDIGLPRMSGFDILHRLRDSKIPVLALTARIDIEDRVHALDTGADDYLAKPFDFRELEARCRAPLRRPSAAGRRRAAFPAIWSSTAPRARSRWPASASSCPREYSLLEILLAGMNRAVSKRRDANKLLPRRRRGAQRHRGHIARLRRKLEGLSLRIETRAAPATSRRAAMTASPTRQPAAKAAGAPRPDAGAGRISIRRRLLAMLLALFIAGGRVLPDGARLCAADRRHRLRTSCCAPRRCPSPTACSWSTTNGAWTCPMPRWPCWSRRRATACSTRCGPATARWYPAIPDLPDPPAMARV